MVHRRFTYAVAGDEEALYWQKISEMKLLRKQKKPKDKKLEDSHRPIKTPFKLPKPEAAGAPLHIKCWHFEP